MTEQGEKDTLEGRLEEIVKTAEHLIDAQYRSKALEESDGGEEGELIEGSDVITFVLLARGFRETQVRVRVQPRSIEVDTPRFFLKRRIPSVSPLTARTTYVNGVLSVTADRELGLG